MAGRHRVRVTRTAARQISAAAAWWRANRPSAPDAVREELEQAFELLAMEPRIGALARNPKLQGVRRVHLNRIRYHVYYRVRDARDTVEILAFWHSSRGSEPVS
jgi:plasmid stabilization system protein ParE